MKLISNIEAGKDLKVNGNIKAVAVTIRDNLVNSFWFEKISRDISCKVCIGAYREKCNAVNQVKLAKDKGSIDAYII